ncbi:MAG TPA: hypothetical protein VGZ68_00435 [Acidimicrobiales bacterium]|jgi:hypothetical protein|nr:hypothetical protein [Acidimicrobiales bacterium]
MTSDSDAKENQPHPSDLSSQGESLQAALDTLATTETGLGFIYSALALLVERFDLLDAVIVLEDDNVGTQIFRHGGKAVSKNFAAQVGVVPGVYCEPRVVVADDLEIVRIACQRQLSTHQRRLGASQEVGAKHAASVREFTPPPAVVASDVAMPFRERVATHETRRVPTPSRTRNARETLSTLLAIVDVMTLALTLANIHGPVRFVFGLVLGIVIPGWSVVGLVKLKNAALEIGLTMAASLSLVMIAAQLMITMKLWHPVVFEELVCVICFPSLFWQSGSRQRRIGRTK